MYLWVRRRSRCVCEPMGMISVLPILNLAPAAIHHSSRILVSSPKSSFSERNTVVSSANRVVFIGYCLLGKRKPCRSDCLMASASGSIAMSNRRHDRGSPCRTPRITLKGREHLTPLIITVVYASL